MEEPRRWQREAMDALWPRLVDRQGPRAHAFSIVMGAGKTKFSLQVAYKVLKDRICDHVVFLTPPSGNVQDQWREAVESLQTILKDNNLPEEARNVSSASFLSVAKKPAIHPRTLVFVDEFHHLSTTHKWGINVQEFAANAADIVMLSATPWREDGHAIPFWTADESFAYKYSYGDSVTDGICRYIVAHDDYDGVMTWTDKGKEWRHKFGETSDDGDFKPIALSKQQDSKRFSTSIKASFTLTQRMIHEADSFLSEMRIGDHPRAQGMIVVSSKLDAEEVAEFLQRECRESPVIVHCDTGKAKRDLEDFTRNTGNLRKWMISITQVSEGTNVPNLCVLVYCSRIRTELFMMQVAGRVIRNSEETPGAKAHIFYPKDNAVRNVFRGLQQEADDALAGNPLTPQRQHITSPEKALSSDDEERECSDPFDVCQLDVDDGSVDGSIDDDAHAWRSISADPMVDDEDEKFKEMLAEFIRRRPSEDPEKVRADSRRAAGLPPVHAIQLNLSVEHEKSRLLEKINHEILSYVRIHGRMLGVRGKKIGGIIAKEKSRLVLRSLKRRRLENDKRRKLTELDLSDLRDIMETSLPSRITKLRRNATVIPEDD